MAHGWTQERRARQAELIRGWRPWEKSTGPTSPTGKARASRNADKGQSRDELRALSKALNRIFREQRAMLRRP